MNPYTGCGHGCVYCYARFMGRYTSHQMPWGTFCDPKVNAVEVLKKQIVKTSPGLVCFSTVTDPYCTIEAKYRVTRKLLEIFLPSSFSISILTKSDLVLQDMDLLQRFPRDRIEVGLSINTLDEQIRFAFEPGAPPIQQRLNALRELHQKGIQTWVFIAPMLPIFNEENIKTFMERISRHADRILFDRLHIKCGNWASLSKTLFRYFPFWLEKWKKILFSFDEKKAYYSWVEDGLLSFGKTKGILVESA